MHIIRKGEMVCYYGSNRGSAHILVSSLSLAARLLRIFDVVNLACVLELSSGGCDFHDTGFDLPHARIRFERKVGKISNSSERTLAGCTSKCVARTLSLTSSSFIQLVYCSVLYGRLAVRACEWNIAPLGFFFSSSTHKGGGWWLLQKGVASWGAWYTSCSELSSIL